MSSYKSDNISLKSIEHVDVAEGGGGDIERRDNNSVGSYEKRDRTGTANESDLTDNSIEDVTSSLLAKEYGHEGFEHSHNSRASLNSRQSLSGQAVRKLSTITAPEDHPKLNTTLWIYCICYTLAAANEYWVVNWLKQNDVNLPIFMAIVQNASWPVQLLFYFRELKKLKTPRVITKQMYKSYAFLGCLAAFIGLSRMYGLSALPPTLYVICANTEIVFETAMTKIILKRDVTILQYIAVGLVIAAVVLSLYNPSDGTFGQGDSTDSISVILIGVALSLASRFASSLNTILAEKFLGKDVKSKIGVSECAVANSVIPFFIIPIMLAIIPEYKRWEEQLIHPKSEAFVTAKITLLFIALCFSKHIDRLSKYGIVDESSTIFFAGVDAQMKMIAGVGSFFFFGEDITWCLIAGFGLVAASVVIMFYDKLQKQKKLEVAKKEDERASQEHPIGQAPSLQTNKV